MATAYDGVLAEVGGGELAGCSQQEGAIIWFADAVEAEHGELVTLDCRIFAAPGEQGFDRYPEGGGDDGDIFAQLAGPIGFPLGDCAAADAAGHGELILGDGAIVAQGADAGADGFCFSGHDGTIR